MSGTPGKHQWLQSWGAFSGTSGPQYLEGCNVHKLNLTMFISHFLYYFRDITVVHRVRFHPLHINLWLCPASHKLTTQVPCPISTIPEKNIIYLVESPRVLNFVVWFFFCRSRDHHVWITGCFVWCRLAVVSFSLRMQCTILLVCTLLLCYEFTGCTLFLHYSHVTGFM